MAPYADHCSRYPRCPRFCSRCCPPFHCRCSPPRSPRPAATTSTNPATWPSPSPSNNKRLLRSDGAGAAAGQRVGPVGHPVHRGLGQGQGRGDRQRDIGDRPRRQAVWRTKRSIFARGEGFGGERGPSTNIAPPDRAPDMEVPLPILPQQALLYRLCGDRNPLHSDPEFAAAAGFPRPILHGLCTYGVACKALVDTLLEGDVSRVHSYGARFAGVVFPGETLRASIWKDDGKLLATITAPSRDDATVLSGVELIPA